MTISLMGFHQKFSYIFAAQFAFPTTSHNMHTAVSVTTAIALVTTRKYATTTSSASHCPDKLFVGHFRLSLSWNQNKNSNKCYFCKYYKFLFYFQYLIFCNPLWGFDFKLVPFLAAEKSAAQRRFVGYETGTGVRLGGADNDECLNAVL